MTNFDPLEILGRHSMTPLEPESTFADSLLAELLENLHSGADSEGTAAPVINIDALDLDEDDRPTGRRFSGPMLTLALTAAAAVLVVLGLNLFGDDRITTDPVDTTTTTTTIVADAAEQPQTPNVRNARTWQQTVDGLGLLKAQDCALVSLPFRSLRATFPDDAVLEGFFKGEQDLLMPVEDVPALLDQGEAFIAAHLDLLSKDVEFADERRAGYGRILEVISDIRTGLAQTTGDVVDVTALFQAGANVGPTNCPLETVIGATQGLASEFTNYSADEPGFGGMGIQAGYRCLAAAAVIAGLQETIEDPSAVSDQRIRNYLQYYETTFVEREPDTAFLDLKASWDSSTTDPASFLAEFENYRATEPDGLVCPLDAGFGE